MQLKIEVSLIRSENMMMSFFKTRFLWSLFMIVTLAGESLAQEKVQFSSEDGLQVTADHYLPKSDRSPYVVLFHQAGWSRGEYLEIAPRLVGMGFGVLAVDQRSGAGVNGVVNETYAAAISEGKNTTYVDALPDMRAAIKFARTNYAPSKLLIWGSSYSAALVLQISGQKSQLVDAVLSFSPGEYFSDSGKSKNWIRAAAKKISVPVFITSAKSEVRSWKEIYKAVPHQNKVFFIANGPGQHGSRTLWRQFPDHVEYWQAVSLFLRDFLPNR